MNLELWVSVGDVQLEGLWLWWFIEPEEKGQERIETDRNRYGFGMTLQIRFARPCACLTFVARSRPEGPTAYSVDAFAFESPFAQICFSCFEFHKNIDVFLTSTAVHSKLYIHQTVAMPSLPFPVIHVRSMEISGSPPTFNHPGISIARNQPN